MTEKTSDASLRRTVEVYAQTGNQEQAATLLGIGQPTLSKRLKDAAARGIRPEGAQHAGADTALPTKVAAGPRRGHVKRYILTCAQNWTKIDEPTWKNLMAFAAHYEAKVLVSTFSYDKDALGQNRLAKRRLTETEGKFDFPKEVIPFINNDRIDLAPNLTWCGELQISPTARRPLQGFESYTYRKSTIVPHTTVALKSVASIKGEGVKLMYTTGCVTQMNYIQRKEGFRAEHFHSYGALLVEIDDRGSWWCRHLTQGKDGAMHDLDARAINGKVTVAKPQDVFVANIAWGDIHASKIDTEVAHASWGAHPGSMLEVLRPESQHLHDVLDSSPYGHHTLKDPHACYHYYVHSSRQSVMTELKTTAVVVNQIDRPWLRTVVVNANHDRHFDRFLREVDWRTDMENAEAILDFNLHVLRAIRLGDADFYLQEYALRQLGVNDKVVFLREDQSDIICAEVDGGIEAGLHGDRGANGAKGTVNGIARTSRAVNMADKHSAAIEDLVFCAGLSARLDMGYNKGLTSWTHSHIVTYANGTRAIYAIWKGKWRA